MPFSCSKFSLFFERVDTISEGATLDCSNGVFRHYDEKTHLCLIHKKRFFVKFWGAKVSMHSWRGHALNTVRVLFRCVC